MLRHVSLAVLLLLTPVTLLGERAPRLDTAPTVVDPSATARAAAVGDVSLPLFDRPSAAFSAPLQPQAQTITLARRGGRRTLTQGGAGQVDSVRVVATGTGNGANVRWQMTAPANRVRIVRGTGSGTGFGVWESLPTGRPVGTTVDTLVFFMTNATNIRTTYLDTVEVVAAQTSITASISETTRFATATAGTPGPADSVQLQISGTNAGSAPWTATATGRRHATVTTTQGTGSASIRWTRDARRPVGTSVDTIMVTVRNPGSAANSTPVATFRVIDVLTVQAAPPAPVPLRIATSSSGRRAAVPSGGSAPEDSVRVTLTGDDAASTRWRATAQSSWLRLTTNEGRGDGWVRWSRASQSLAAGTYVDAITIRIEGASNVAVGTATVTDTLIVAQQVLLTVGPQSRSDSATSGMAETRNDSASVSISSGSPTLWSASARAPWIRLVTASGTAGASAPGRLRWSRITGDLRPGTYVDTIVVRAANGLEAVLVDTLAVRAPASVTAERAIAALRGTVQLQLHESRYLDLVGNRDNVLNLGDILAQLEREGLMPSAALLGELAPIPGAAPDEGARPRGTPRGATRRTTTRGTAP